ncbi:MAG: hypothetical protein ACI4CS_11990 [Candidatus Weimeria sp.]
MKDYINGCYTRYGTRALKQEEIITSAALPNGMFAAIGVIPGEKDGISVDVYYDKDRKNLVFMEHGITAYNMDIHDVTVAKALMIEFACSRCKEMGLL